MTDIQFSPDLVSRSLETRPNATWGTTLAAGILVLALGLGAVYQHNQRVDAPAQAATGQSETTTLDGRGKWGGYTKP